MSLEGIMAEKMIAAKAAVDAGEDKGHTALIEDLTPIFEDAKNLEFHDYLNKKHATPKVTLRSWLYEIIKNIEEGKYDN